MIEAKHVIFFLGSAVCVPAGIIGALFSRKIHDFVFMFLVFGTTQPGSLFGLPTDINFLSREWYRGTTRGIEVSYLDLLAIILLVSSVIIRRREGRPLFWPPSLGPMLAFFGWCAINVLVFSDPKLFGIFELTKVARGILLFVAVAMYVRSTREVRVFIVAIACTTLYETFICLRDRYLFSRYRVWGTLDHPNTLSMYCLQGIPLLLAGAFARTTSVRLRQFCFFAYLGAVACVIMSISRTGFAVMLVLSIVGLLLFGVSSFARPRNLAYTSGAILLCGLMLLRSWDTVMYRLGGFDFEHEYFSEEGDRGSYFRQALPAINAKPVPGVGLNNWSYWITNQYAVLAGYDSLNDRLIEQYHGTDEAPKGEGQAAPAHNLYLLTLTELGFPGLFLLLLLFGRWIFAMGKALFVKRHSVARDIQIAAFLSFAGVVMQSWTEWAYRQTSIYFLAHIIVAVALTASLSSPKGNAA